MSATILAAALFAFGPPPASAQQPGPGEEIEEQAPQEHVLRDQALRKWLEGLPAAEREALLRRRRGQAGRALPMERKATSSAEAKLEQTDANLVTRGAAGLTGVNAGATSIADVDGDGSEDLLITGFDGSGRSATLYLGAGDGSFQEANAGLIGVSAGATSIADVDGDGNQDLLITGRDENFDPTATLYLGKGDGSFQEANASLVGVGRSATSIADVDNDGNLDLLITGRDENFNLTATLYLGNGDGSFEEAGASLTGVSAGATSIADVDDDGNEDLLITGSGSATLYLGDGDGSFQEAGAGLAGVFESATSIADVNGDGNEDLLITGDGTFPNPEKIATLYLGNGDGSFEEADASLTGVSNSATSIADVDGDGNRDLLITGDGSATLYLGAGDGSFQEAGAGLTGVSAGATSIADVDSDGDEDLLIAGQDNLFGASARLYVNRAVQTDPNRSPRFGRTFGRDRLAAGLTLTRLVEAGDPDGDRLSIMAAGGRSVSVEDAGNGVAEVRFTPARSQGGGTAEIQIEASDSEGSIGTFREEIEVPGEVAAFGANLAGTLGGAASTADVNNDGNDDLLITGRDENRAPSAILYLGAGDGSFQEAGANLTEVRQSATSAADVNNDGNQDLLITGDDESNGPTATLYLGVGDGTFQEAGAGLTGVERGATSIADVDGDGNDDLLITGFDGSGRSATLYLGVGDGTFQEAGAGLTGVSNSATSIADVDNDGNQDLLIAGRDENRAVSTTLYLGNGDGTFQEANAGLTDVEGGATSIADVDGDGNEDLLITGSGSATLYLGAGDGSFQEANASLAGVSRSASSIADVDGDGSEDLLVTGRDENFDPSATLYLGNGDGSFQEAGAGLAGVFGGATSIVDADGDGDQDLLVTGFSEATSSLSSVLYENLFSNPLPVELVALEAEADGEAVRLSWQTASETGNAAFEVQRKRVQRQGEEGAWATVGRVDGAGTTTEPQSYRYVDPSPPFQADRLTYRLRQVDTDGTASYSDPVTIERRIGEVELLGTAPNPARRQATVRFALPETKETTLRLYDALGREVRTVASGPKEGRHEQRLDVSGLSSGVYFLRLRAGGEVRTRKLTVVK